MSNPDPKAELASAIEDYDRALDEHGNYPGEAEAELEAFMNSLEGKLAPFSTAQLQDELNRRMFEPYIKSLKEMRDALDRLVIPF